MRFKIPEVKVIATDLDGTFFHPKKRIKMIPKKNLRFAQRFIDDGGKLVLVSSRSENFIKPIAERLGRPFDFIGSDGCFAMIDGEMRWQKFFEPKVLMDVVKAIQANYSPWIFMLGSKDKPLVSARTGVKWIVNVLYKAYMFFQGVLKETPIKSDEVFYSEIEKGEVYKLRLFIGFTKKQMLKAKRLAEEINAKYDSIEAHWLNEVIEITPKGYTKADGVAKYLDYLGLTHDNIVVVGDGGNDVPMFDRFHAHSYAMGHAHQWVKSHASKTIESFADLEEELYPSADSETAK